MVRNPLLVVDEVRTLLELLGDLGMLVEELIHGSYFAACDVVVVPSLTVLSLVLNLVLRYRGLRFCSHRRSPNKGSKREGCQPMSSSQSCPFHKLNPPKGLRNCDRTY